MIDLPQSPETAAIVLNRALPRDPVPLRSMATKHRPAVRIVCLDAADRVLLLHWQDPYDGSQLWEPPGGGIEPGETPLQAACRELVEETGLDPATIGEHSVTVERDLVWNGNRYVGPEEFFLARFSADQPALARTGLLPDEQVNLQEQEWVPRSALAGLPGRLEPPELATVIDALVVL
jgi:8-oxo-dGTP pyrophosphatase MutT (NUDIX family)